MTRNAIEAQGLTRSFGSTVAVDEVSFVVPEGSAVGLLGGTGAGKSTTLMTLLGELTPTKGTARVFGVDCACGRHAATREMSANRGPTELEQRLTLREFLTERAHLRGVLGIAGRVRELCADLRLEGALERPVGALSLGSGKRAALAAALISRPRLLLLDEPTDGMDAETADIARARVDRHRAEVGATLLIASRDLAEVERLCETVLMMRRGGIVDRGSPAELLERYGRATLERRFLDGSANRRDETAAD